jgi:hypothetical protein
MEEPIEIQKKKRPVALIVIFLIALASFACWLLIVVIYPTLPGFLDFKISALAAICAATLFGIVMIVKQSSSKQPGLLIGEDGLTDHSNIASVGFIPWGDIDSIKVVDGDFKRPLIVVVVRNPETYINKVAKMSMSRDYQFQHYGSPILINPASLDYPVQMLVNLLTDRVMR